MVASPRGLRSEGVVSGRGMGGFFGGGMGDGAGVALVAVCRRGKEAHRYWRERGEGIGCTGDRGERAALSRVDLAVQHQVERCRDLGLSFELLMGREYSETILKKESDI